MVFLNQFHGMQYNQIPNVGRVKELGFQLEKFSSLRILTVKPALLAQTLGHNSFSNKIARH